MKKIIKKHISPHPQGKAPSYNNTTIGFIIPKMVDFAYKIDLATKVRGSRVNVIAIGIDLAFLILLGRKWCSITR